MGSAVDELCKATCLFRKRMPGAVACSANPPDPHGPAAEDSVQHGQNGSCPDAGTEQDDRRIAGSEGKSREAH
jgi:hypothetical protein